MKAILSNIEKFNRFVAERTVSLVGTMWCAYAFTVLVVIPLFNENLTTIIMFISSSLLQLVLLPVIMVGQRYQGDAAEKRSKEDHEHIIKMHKEIHGILKEIHEKVHSK